MRYLRKFIAVHLHFEGDYASWEAALEKCSGYNTENILVKALEATLYNN